MVKRILRLHLNSAKGGLNKGISLVFNCLFYFQIKQRFIVNMPTFKVRVIDKDGIRDLPDIVAT